MRKTLAEEWRLCGVLGRLLLALAAGIFLVEAWFVARFL